MRGVSLQSPRKIQPGQVLKYNILIDGADGSADHAIRVEVINPEGRGSECYRHNVLALKGRYEGKIPFALNDPPGTWQIRVTDIISGKEAARAVIVKK